MSNAPTSKLWMPAYSCALLKVLVILLTYHSLRLSYMLHLNTWEIGKPRLAMCLGRGNRF